MSIDRPSFKDNGQGIIDRFRHSGKRGIAIGAAALGLAGGAVTVGIEQGAHRDPITPEVTTSSSHDPSKKTEAPTKTPEQQRREQLQEVAHDVASFTLTQLAMPEAGGEPYDTVGFGNKGSQLNPEGPDNSFPDMYTRYDRSTHKLVIGSVLFAKSTEQSVGDSATGVTVLYQLPESNMLDEQAQPLGIADFRRAISDANDLQLVSLGLSKDYSYADRNNPGKAIGIYQSGDNVLVSHSANFISDTSNDAYIPTEYIPVGTNGLDEAIDEATKLAGQIEQQFAR